MMIHTDLSLQHDEHVQSLTQRITELERKIADMESQNRKLLESQLKLGEVTNNYLMLHYLNKNIHDCKTSQKLYETYLHNITDGGFNYNHVTMYLPDENFVFGTKLSLNQGQLSFTEVDEQELDEFVITAIRDRMSTMSADNTKAAIPLVNNCLQVRALLVAEKHSGISFEDVELLDVYAQQTIATIENVTLNERLMQYQDLLGNRLDQFVLLHYITKEIHDALEYQEVLEKYLNVLASPMGFNFKDSIMYIIEDNTIEKIRLENEQAIIRKLENLDDELVIKAFKERRPQMDDSRQQLTIPLISGGQVSAVIEVVDDKEIDSERVQIVEIFALQTSSVLRNTKLRDRLEYLSFRDALTGLYNRAFFQHEMQRFQSEATTPFGIIACDVDGLKIVNDNLGHDAGDELIINIARILGGSIDKKHLAARVGGDEFVVLLPCETAERVAQVTDAIRNAIAWHNSKKPRFPLGLSVGYAASTQVTNLQELFKQADGRMYEDKMKNGAKHRNAIIKVLEQNMACK